MPAPTNYGLAKKALSSQITQLGGLATQDDLTAVYAQYYKAAADAMASTTTADTVIWVNPYPYPLYVDSGRIVGVAAGIATDETDYVTITIKTNDGAGGSTAIALTYASNAAGGGALTSNQSKAFPTLTRANITVPVGGQLWINIAKAGAGKVVPISYFFVKMFRAES